MDESTAAVVNTIVTVFGMIVAFFTALITAFLAEPIKDFYQNRASLNRLRVALYKELLFNYDLLEYFGKYDDFVQENSLDTVKDFKKLLRTECYDDVIANNANLFYQLKEAGDINYVYAIKEMMISELRAKNKDEFDESAQAFRGNIALYIDDRTFDPTLMTSMLDQDEYNAIRVEARKYSEKMSKESEESDSDTDATQLA